MINRILNSKTHQLKHLKYKNRIEQLTNEVNELTALVVKWQYKLRAEYLMSSCTNYAEEVRRMKVDIALREAEINSLSRIEPFSYFHVADRNFGFFFWHLDCMPRSLIVEKRFQYEYVASHASNLAKTSSTPLFGKEQDEENDDDDHGDTPYTVDSQWFIIDDLDKLKTLFEVISDNSIDSSLPNGIWKIIERIARKADELPPPPPSKEDRQIELKSGRNTLTKTTSDSYISPNIARLKAAKPDLFALGLSYSASNLKNLNESNRARKLETVESKLNEMDTSGQTATQGFALFQVSFFYLSKFIFFIVLNLFL